MADMANNSNGGQEKGSLSEVDNQVLDLKHLAQYTNGDKALEHELLGLFKQQASLQFEKVASAFDTDDWKMATHTLKGSARGIGAIRIAQLAADLEDIGFEGDEAEKQTVISGLQAEIAICLEQIDKIIG